MNKNVINVILCLYLLCGTALADTTITPHDIITGAIYAPTGRSATIVVAASDSSAASKEQADYVCDGVADDVQIQAAIDALPVVGGIVRLCEGSYESNAITLSNNVTLTGAGYPTSIGATGYGTSFIRLDDGCVLKNLCIDCNSMDFGVFVAGNYVTVDNIYLENTSADGILIGQPSEDIHDIYINNVRTNNTGTSKGSSVQVFQGAYNVIISNCVAHNFSDSAYNIHDHVDENSPHDVIVTNCIMDTAIAGGGTGIGSGITVAASTNAGDIYNVLIDNCHISNTLYGIYVNKIYNIDISSVTINDITQTYMIHFLGENRATVSTCHFNNSLASGIGINQIGASGQYTLSNNVFNDLRNYGMWIESPNAIITGNRFFNIGAGASGSGIRLLGSDACISNNVFDNILRYGIWFDGGNAIVSGNVFDSIGISVLLYDSAIMRNNIGYVSENSGNASIVSGTTSIIVSHGLADTPTRVQVTPTNNPTNAVSFWWVDTLTSTQFTIHCNTDPGATGLTFDWRAVAGEGN